MRANYCLIFSTFPAASEEHNDIEVFTEDIRVYNDICVFMEDDEDLLDEEGHE